MKNTQSRKDELLLLARNIEIILQNENQKSIAFTTDTTAYDVNVLIHELANIYVSQNRKVAIVSYNEIPNKVNTIDYYDIDIVKDYNDDVILKNSEKYDIILINCPNPIISKHYLHIAHFTKAVTIIAKKWKSKIANINTIKEIAQNNNLNLLGVIYEK